MFAEGALTGMMSLKEEIRRLEIKYTYVSHTSPIKVTLFVPWDRRLMTS